MVTHMVLYEASCRQTGKQQAGEMGFAIQAHNNHQLADISKWTENDINCMARVTRCMSQRETRLDLCIERTVLQSTKYEV